MGNMEFFRNEFVTPIDKFGEQDSERTPSQTLVSLYILRRTKEQGQGFCRKNRTILFCETEEQQRTIYDLYRTPTAKRSWVLMTELPNRSFTILQGLMKLRQIW